MPLMPSVNSRPSANVGVDFGPGPWRRVAGLMSNGAGYLLRQMTSPDAASSAIMTSSSSCRVYMKIRSPTRIGVA